ncbi:Uncharacterised protein [Mycobacteroides abscessus subsp. abscessus]|nr:Uncharacterised protein [Mycobacteroides abscessus subsp. abscessus]
MFYKIGKTTMGTFAKGQEQSYQEYWKAAEEATSGGKTGNPIIDEGLDYLRENLGSDTIDQGIEYLKDKIVMQPNGKAFSVATLSHEFDVGSIE